MIKNEERNIWRRSIIRCEVPKFFIDESNSYRVIWVLSDINFTVAPFNKRKLNASHDNVTLYGLIKSIFNLKRNG